MRVVSVRLSGFRRYRQATLNVDAPLVAIVGPNQAGKSSLIAGLQFLNHSDPIEIDDLRRGETFADDHTVIEARYRLDASDREAVAGILGGTSVRFLRQDKHRDGTLRYATEPRLTRDQSLRTRARTLLTQALGLRATRETETEESDEDDPSLASLLRSISEGLETTSEDLPPAVLDEIANVAAQIDDEPPNSILGRLRLSLEHLVASERATNPHTVAVGILAPRRPRFLEFDEDDRDLQPDYDLTAVAADPPAALDNLVALAGLDLQQLLAAVQRGDGGEIETLEDHANEELRRVFTEAWRQSPVTVRLRHAANQRIDVLVSADADRWASIAESSDGLRTFVALVAYLAAHEATSPVLLVDEAETHLHYDAQADLVRMFERQTAAAQVIYTTHSAGCLPPDLGRGIRVIEAHDSGDSHIRNSFWSLGSGFSPLVMAMGASVLAFTATRYAVIGEGGTETVLLPSLLREATGMSTLPYQVAPGLAEASDDTLRAMDLEAARVVFVVDGDAEGDKHQNRLLRLNVARPRIGRLPQGMSIEDLLDGALYLDAVNQELVERHGSSARIPQGQLPVAGRASFVKHWCERHGFSEVSKPGVAARLVDSDPDVPFTAPGRRHALRAIHNRFSRAFGLPELTASSPRQLAALVQARRGERSE